MHISISTHIQPPSSLNGVMQAFQQAGFYAPLTSSLNLVYGSGSATFTRATSGTCFGYKESDVAGASQSLLTIPAGIPRFPGARFIASNNTWSTVLSDGTPIPDSQLLGVLIEPSATNYFLNSGAPVTQTITLGTGTYTCWLTGTGSIVIASGTATITGAGTATSAVPVTFVVTVAGTITATVTGTVTLAQIENFNAPTSYIATTGVAVIRNADVLTYSSSGNVNAALGTSYVEWTPIANIPTGTTLSFGDNYFLDIGTNQCSLLRYNGNIDQASKGGNIVTGPVLANAVSGTKYKIAGVFGNITPKSCLNGVLGTAGVAITGNTIGANIVIGGSGAGTTVQALGTIKNVFIWQTQLADTTLQVITI